MKKSINFLCVLIICVIIASIIMPTYKLGYSFGAGFKLGWEDAQKGTPETSIFYDNTPISVDFSPNISKVIDNPDTIHTNSNEPISVIWTQGSIFVDDDLIPNWITIICSICQLLALVIVIILIIKFIRLIININKDIIFDKKNVKLLRQLGFMLLSVSILQIISGFTTDIIVKGLNYTFDGYNINASWILPWGNLLFGLISYLMAQIWARGIQMREEQELTI